jgi:hypothetical protein
MRSEAAKRAQKKYNAKPEVRAKHRERNKRYYAQNQNEMIERARRYRKTPEGRAITLKNAKKQYWADREKALAINREYSKTYRWNLRLECIKEYGGKCACCGETNPKFLTIDHIHNDGHKEGRVRGNYPLKLKRLGYPKDRHQILCFNCNCGRAYNRGLCPHHDSILT